MYWFHFRRFILPSKHLYNVIKKFRTTLFFPEARATESAESMVAINASWDIGRTSPVVPKMEIPPMIPRLLKKSMISERVPLTKARISVASWSFSTNPSGIHTHGITINSAGEDGTGKNIPKHYEVIYCVKQ